MPRHRSNGIAVLVGLIVLFGSAAPTNALAAGERPVCPGPAAPGFARCHAWVLQPQTTSGPAGLSPAGIKSVYKFPTSSTAGAGKTIAIVDAYNDPSIGKDLNVFSSKFGLPACTFANGCFRKVDEHGGTNYPRTDGGWALEISLDVEWAHAIAPGARILLVEASSANLKDFMAAEDYAKAHANYVSNSWGGSEFSGEANLDSHFTQAGVGIFASAGDAGLPAQYPSASPKVISVGGTSLHFSGGSFTSETGWGNGGGGCSSYETASAAQSGFGGYKQVNCGGKRATPDVALDADPASGVSVYDSTVYQSQSGWWVLGGTSASSPMWAARAADDKSGVVKPGYIYSSNITFRDATSGYNGAPCLVGYDLCTGRGSWVGATP